MRGGSYTVGIQIRLDWNYAGLAKSLRSMTSPALGSRLDVQYHIWSLSR